MSYQPKTPPDLETLIREKQDQLRGRPEYWWEIVRDNATFIDCVAAGIMFGLLIRGFVL